jgi:hypothetical protein
VGPGRRRSLTSHEVDDLAAVLAADLQRVDDRRERGAFFTPPDVAERLTALALGPTNGSIDGPTSGTVVDPACGAGVFLLAAGRLLVDQGVADPATVVRHHLFGADIDPASVEVTRRLLATWAGIEPGEVAGVVVGDPLHHGRDVWAGCPGGGATTGFDAVVGNPPFLGQLRASTVVSAADRERLRQRFPGLVAAYTDVAWLFLAVGLDLLANGGRMVLIQPQSVLAARDAGPVRDLVVSTARLAGIWWDRSEVFAGHAEVCAPVVERSPGGRGPRVETPVEVFADREVTFAGRSPEPAVGETWGGVVASVLRVPPGVPAVGGTTTGGSVGTMGAVTAGFRQHFYGLVTGVVERSSPDDPRPPMVTTGSVDPLHLRWGDRPCRFDGRRWQAPVVDLDAVTVGDPEVGRWFAERRRPKLLVASQTAVVEVVVDPTGDLVPVTPLIVVEPVALEPAGRGREVDPEVLWRLAAALSAPSITALAVRRSLGAARSSGRLRLSAAQVSDLPLPTDAGAWDEGAALARTLHRSSGAPAASDAWRAFGRVMAAAYGVVDPEAVATLVDWWWSRHPARH